MKTFAAIDFETATASRNSACAIGVVIVEQGAVVAQDARLIKPPENLYDTFNISIHGITPSQTKTAGTFAEVWPEIEALIDGRLVIAHNAAFDISVLRHCAANYGYLPSDCRFACSYRMAKKIWPDRWSYRLNDLAAELGIALKHHDALSDANAAAEITLSALASCSCESVEDMAETLGYRIGEVSGSDYKGFSNAKVVARRPRQPWEKPELSRQDGDPYSENHPLFERLIAFTGKLESMTRREAQHHAENVGARIADGVVKSLDYLVVGEINRKVVGTDGLSGKLRKAIGFSESGSSIEITGEVEFLEMLGDT